MPRLPLAAAAFAALALAACRAAPEAPGGKTDAPASTPAPPAAADAPARGALRVDSVALVDTLAPVASGGAEAEAFGPFLDAFRAAVRRRDANAVRRVLSPTVTSSFGGDATPEAFFRPYPLDDPASEAWADLEGLLAGPPGDDDGTMVFPAAFARQPPAALRARHPDAQFVVTEEAADVRDPSSGAVLARVEAGTWLPVCAGLDTEQELAYCVTLPDGRDGLVPEAAVYSPLGLRLGFRQEGGRWRLVFFVAGD